MPIRDQAAMEASLDNDYGPTRGPHAPDSFEVALFSGDPMTDGVEVPATTELDDTSVVPNGYARVVHANHQWAPAADGVKQTDPSPEFPAPTEEWPVTVTHWALYDPIAGVWWDCAPLTEPLDVTGPGGPIRVTLSVFYDDNLND